MNLYKWSTTASDNDSAVPDGAPEGWLGQNVNDWARESMARIREHASDAAYIDENYNLGTVGAKTITRISATQLTIANCDATAYFTAGRRIRVVGATTDHGFVTSSSYGAPTTTVNVSMDSGDVPTTPTQVLVHIDAKLRDAAYYKSGSGNLLNADLVDGYHAADIFGPAIFAEAIINGGMAVAQRGTAILCPVNTKTLTADRWFCNPAAGTGSLTWFQTKTTLSGAVSKYGSRLLGASGITGTVDFGQRIESSLIPYIKTTVTISALVKNETAASLALQLRLGTPAAADDFTTVTNRLGQTMTSIASGTTQRISYTVDISGYTNIDNGLELVFRVPAGSLSSSGKSLTITEVQIDRASAFNYFRFRPFQDELLRCQRFYNKTFAYETVPEQDWTGGGTGFQSGALVIPGSSFSSGSDNTGVSWMFPTIMRATPTVVTFNPGAADAKAVNISGSDSKTVTATASTSGVILSISAAVNDRAYVVGATAEAEL